MTRRNFAKVLEAAGYDVYYEYLRLWNLFYCDEVYYTVRYTKNRLTLDEACEKFFRNFPVEVRGTCISLEDFARRYNWDFYNNKYCHDIDTFISFAEFVYNMTETVKKYVDLKQEALLEPYCDYVLKHIQCCIENIGYQRHLIRGLTVFAVKDVIAVSVAEILPADVSYRIIEYGHHTLKGNVQEKRNILLQLAKIYEPQHNTVAMINNQLASNINKLLNNMNIRHNNVDGNNGYYKECVAKFTSEQLEQWYDDLYELMLQAFLEMDNIDRNKRVKELKFS